MTETPEEPGSGLPGDAQDNLSAPEPDPAESLEDLEGPISPPAEEGTA